MFQIRGGREKSKTWFKVYVQRSFTLDSGVEMRNVPVAYMTWGTLSPRADNVIVVCHALSGSADLSDWWGPLLGSGQAFDTDQFFVICMNSLGSPYGTASPVTAKNGDHAEGWYGADFPSTTIRDDVRLHRLLLNDLGVRRVAAVVGGSMGGMHALEWGYEGKDYVCCIVAIATCAHQGAWAIGWGETQRHAIYHDPKFHGGRYSLDDPPIGGLEAARMAALLTYRSRDALEHRFSRQGYDSKEKGITTKHIQKTQPPKAATPSSNPTFVVQSYLRYQAKKFTHRFDSNCYLALTHKLDSHDVARGRADTIADALALIEQPTLVLGIKSDGLYTFADQEELARSIPRATLREIVSEDGHDAFLIESRQINDILKGFWYDHLRDMI
ncbi:Alpha/Beta hydrolase protein [Trichoderma evansii]